jgi:hypothetical protein
MPSPACSYPSMEGISPRCKQTTPTLAYSRALQNGTRCFAAGIRIVSSVNADAHQFDVAYNLLALRNLGMPSAPARVVTQLHSTRQTKNETEPGAVPTGAARLSRCRGAIGACSSNKGMHTSLQDAVRA